MKIIHVVKRYPDSFGGDAIVVWQLAKQQRDRGENVRIVTSNCKEIRNEKGLTKVGLAITSNEIDSINLKRIITMFWMVLWSFWYLKRERPDIIHSHTADFGFAVSWAARFYRIPIINTCHGVTYLNLDHSFLKRRLERFLLKAARFKIILSVDKNSIIGFKKAGFNNARYFANAIDVERFKKQAKIYESGRLEILCVARMEEAKGIRYLLEAVSILKIDWRLRLISEGSKLESFRDYAKELGIGNKVHFLGQISPTKNADYYAESHLFILPSLHEGFPIVLLESWITGVPIIITDVGTISNVCKDKQNALIIAPASSNEISQAIERFLKSKKLRETLAKNGRKEVVSFYTYERIVTELMTIYKEAKS